MLARHPRLRPGLRVAYGPEIRAGLDVPLVDEAGQTHLIHFEMTPLQLVDLAAEMARAAAAMMRREAHESAITSESAPG